MKKNYLGFVAISAVASMFIAGCASISPEDHILPEPKSLSQADIAAKMSPSDSKQESIARPFLDQNVSGSFFKTPIYDAMKQMGDQVGAKIDSSFRPSEKYRVTADFQNSKLSDFILLVKQTTGVDYRVRNGLLTVVNKDLIDESIAGKQCSAVQSPTVTMSVVEPVYPDQVFKMFSDKYHMSFVYKTRFYDLAGEGSQQFLPAQKVSFHYSGCDAMEAFRSFLKASNLTAEETSPGTFTIMDYEAATIDIPLYFDYSFTSTVGVNSSGSTSSSSTGSGSGGSDNGVKGKEDQKDSLEKYIKNYLTSKGKVDVSNRGYITIVDTPETVRLAKKLLAKEIAKQTPIKLNISIIRTDLSNDVSAGVDWAAVGDFFTNGTKFELGVNNAAKVTPGGYLRIDANMPALINALEKYGNTKVVRDYNAITKLGVLNSFKAVEQIPYVTTNTTVSSGVAQTNLEAKVAEAGVIINVMPRLDAMGENIDMSTSIVVSELVKMVHFTMSGSDFDLPQIATNEVSIPAKVRMNQTLVLTGFKTTSKAGSSEGLPGGSKMPTGLQWLMGTESNAAGVSEFAVVITPSSMEEN